MFKNNLYSPPKKISPSQMFKPNAIKVPSGTVVVTHLFVKKILIKKT